MDLQERVNALMAATVNGSPLEQLMLREVILGHDPLTTAHPGGSETHVVVFESRREAIFKPFSGQSRAACTHYQQDPLEAVVHEVAAWRLASAMGEPWEQLVPTAVLRTLSPIGAGALVNRRRGTPDPRVFEQAQAQVDAAAFWDALIGQQDRHATNFRYELESRSLALIDHAFCFAVPGVTCNGGIFAARRRSERRGKLKQNELDALEALLGSGDLYGLRGYLADGRADALERRAQTMVSYPHIPVVGAF